MKPCGLLLVGPKTCVYSPSRLVILAHLQGAISLTEIDCEGKSRGRILCVFPKFHTQYFNQFFDTVDRLRVLILTTWFFSGNTSGYMNQRNTELLTFSAGLGRNTAGPLGSMLKKLSKLISDSETLRFSLLFTYNFIAERSREKVGKPNG
jgi:hypothetical protein